MEREIRGPRAMSEKRCHSYTWTLDLRQVPWSQAQSQQAPRFMSLPPATQWIWDQENGFPVWMLVEVEDMCINQYSLQKNVC